MMKYLMVKSEIHLWVQDDDFIPKNEIQYILMYVRLHIPIKSNLNKNIIMT